MTLSELVTKIRAEQREIQNLLNSGVAPTDNRVKVKRESLTGMLDEYDLAGRLGALDELEPAPVSPFAVGASRRGATASRMSTLSEYAEADAYLRGREHQTLRVQSDGSAGYTVPPSLAENVLLDPQAQGALRRAGSDERIVDSDEYEEILLSGDIVAPAPEIPAASESTNPDITLWQRTLTKFRTLQFITEQQRADEHTDLTEALVRHIVDQMMVSEDLYLSNGDGIGLNPLGFLRDAAITQFDVEGTTATTISNTTASAGSAAKIVQMMGQLPSRFHDGAVWMMDGATLAAIRALVDADGRPYFPETYTGSVLVGKPIILNDGFPVGGTADQPVIAFANFRRGFRLLRKPDGISIRVLNELYANVDSVGVRGIYRVGGGVILPQAFVIGVADAVA